ncbi:urease accessory protein UreD [Pseudooctadecabacter sp.]|uniref:urease accessory protein UreD n=1 Tax=Pseudooctadecabacter sp. TaxID=1966338 RepID=UPI003F6C6B6F
MVFPRHAGRALQAVTVNTAGGVTGGDRFDAQFAAGLGTDLTVTTQAAERAYRANSDTPGTVTTRLAVDAGARLSWLPQETILFDGAAFSRRMTVDLAPDAQLLFVEPLVFGRTAGGEVLEQVRFHDTVTIRRGDTPLFCDAVGLAGDVSAQMHRRAGGAVALASVVYVAPYAEATLADVRALLPPTAGASLMADDVLHVRLLAQDSFELRKTLIPVLERLSTDPLPRVWRI